MLSCYIHDVYNPRNAKWWIVEPESLPAPPSFNNNGRFPESNQDALVAIAGEDHTTGTCGETRFSSSAEPTGDTSQPYDCLAMCDVVEGTAPEFVPVVADAAAVTQFTPAIYLCEEIDDSLPQPSSQVVQLPPFFAGNLPEQEVCTPLTAQGPHHAMALQDTMSFYLYEGMDSHSLPRPTSQMNQLPRYFAGNLPRRACPGVLQAALCATGRLGGLALYSRGKHEAKGTSCHVFVVGDAADRMYLLSSDFHVLFDAGGFWMAHTEEEKASMARHLGALTENQRRFLSSRGYPYARLKIEVAAGTQR